MTRLQEPGKRIVSKGEAAIIQFVQGGIHGVGLVVMAAAGLLVLTAIACGLHFVRVIGLVVKTQDRTLSANAGMYGTAMCLLAGAAFLLGKAGYMTVMKAEKLMETVPLTRETADLPAPDSLVRASQEPAQAQETMLLRAATQTRERHGEQLLRASAEK